MKCYLFAFGFGFYQTLFAAETYQSQSFTHYYFEGNEFAKIVGCNRGTLPAIVKSSG